MNQMLSIKLEILVVIWQLNNQSHKNSLLENKIRFDDPIQQVQRQNESWKSRVNAFSMRNFSTQDYINELDRNYFIVRDEHLGHLVFLWYYHLDSISLILRPWFILLVLPFWFYLLGSASLVLPPWFLRRF